MKGKIKIIKNKGFTLIELMITVAIVGILAAIALPAYQDYTIKAQVSEGFQLIWGVQTAVAEYYTTNGALAVDNTALSLSATGVVGKYVSSVVNTNGSIVLTFGNQSNIKIVGKTMSLTATPLTDGTIKWVCTPVTLPLKYVPTSCI